MSEQKQQIIAVLDMLLETTDVLIPALARKDEDKAYEAATILMTQALQSFGMEHPVFQQFFPVMDVIEKRISRHDLDGAKGQAEVFQSQLVEIKEIIKSQP
jgi:hypothetical protein